MTLTEAIRLMRHAGIKEEKIIDDTVILILEDWNQIHISSVLEYEYCEGGCCVTNSELKPPTVKFIGIRDEYTKYKETLNTFIEKNGRQPYNAELIFLLSQFKHWKLFPEFMDYTEVEIEDY